MTSSAHLTCVLGAGMGLEFYKRLGENVPAWVRNSIPVVSIVLGPAFIALAAFVVTETVSADWHRFLSIAGSALLGGGVFSATIKSAQFTDVFSGVVSKVVTDKVNIASEVKLGVDGALAQKIVADQGEFGPSGMIGQMWSTHAATVVSKAVRDEVWNTDFIGMRNDLEDVWKKVGHALCDRRFPLVKTLIDKELLAGYLPTQRNFYYDENHRRFGGIEVQDGVMSIEQSAEVHLIPHNNAPHMDYHDRYKPNGRGRRERLSFKVFRVVNGQERQLDETEISACQQDTGASANETSILYHFPVAEGPNPVEKYRIERQDRHHLDLRVSPYLKFKFNTYVRNLSVEAGKLPDGYACDFESVGTLEEFKDIDPPPTAALFKKKYGSILLPKQGFMLVFHEA